MGALFGKWKHLNKDASSPCAGVGCIKKKKRLYVWWTLSKTKQNKKTLRTRQKKEKAQHSIFAAGTAACRGAEPAVAEEETRVWRQGDEEFKQNEACRLVALPSVTGVISGGSLSLCLLPLFIWAQGRESWRLQPANQIKEVMFIYPPINFLTSVESAIALKVYSGIIW